jgi:hypothetical protein
MAGNNILHNVSFDLDTRKEISQEILNCISSVNKTSDFEILVVGSPNAWEVQDIDEEISMRSHLLCLDLSEKTNFEVVEKKYKTANHIVTNFFNHEFKKKFDIIVSRWMFHHLTSLEKRLFYSKCKSILNSSGCCIVVDYFFNDFLSIEERIKVGIEHMSYRRVNADPPFSDPSDEKLIKQIINAEVANHRGGKMDSVKNVTQYSEESNFYTTSKLTIDSLKYDRPDLWGQYKLTSFMKNE